MPRVNLVRCAIAAALLASGPLCSQAEAVPMLGATVRDFREEHPDFEAGINRKVVVGLVAETLGLDGTPDLAAPGGGTLQSGFIASSESFEQWFKDVPSVNTTLPTVFLPLTKRAGGGEVFRFEDRGFFLADGSGFGNDGEEHNYWFTVRVSVPFVYSGDPAEDVLTIGGDDDIWLFINGRLAADLGGVHSFAATTVNLATFGLAPGSLNTYDLFFAERHRFASGLVFEVPNPSPVPEPPAAWLLGTGLLGLAAMGLARHRADAGPLAAGPA